MHYRSLSVVAIFAILSCLSCKARDTKAKILDDGAQADAFDVLMDGGPSSPDLPPVGRSLFDYLVQDGIPPTIEAMIAKIQSLSSDSNYDYPLPGHGNQTPPIVLIPYSRSLQREFVDPSSPRVIVGADAPPKITETSLGMTLNYRLYIAYAERANQLEVISYNEKAGRFEFQVVKDFGSGHPAIFYAKRSLCAACHQNYGPIFSVGPWSETNGGGGGFATTSMLAASPASQNFHGVYRGELRAKYGAGEPRSESAPRIDRSIEEAFHFPVLQRLWNSACRGNTEEGLRCRGLILKALLLKPSHARSSVPGDLQARISEAVAKNWSVAFPLRTVSAPSQVLKNRNVRPGSLDAYPVEWTFDLKNPADPEAISKNQEILRAAMALALTLAPDEDPLTSRFNPESTEAIPDDPSYSPMFYRDIDNSRPGPFSAQDLELITQGSENKQKALEDVIDKLVASDLASDNKVLGSGPLQRGPILKALLKIVNPSDQHAVCCQVDDFEPKPQLMGNAGLDGFKEAAAQMKALPYFDKYCGDCHRGEGSIDFLSGANLREIKTKLATWAPRIIRSLDWASNPPKPMPRGSNTMSKLRSNPRDKDEMIAAMRALIGSAP